MLNWEDGKNIHISSFNPNYEVILAVNISSVPIGSRLIIFSFDNVSLLEYDAFKKRYQHYKLYCLDLMQSGRFDNGKLLLIMCDVHRQKNNSEFSTPVRANQIQGNGVTQTHLFQSNMTNINLLQVAINLLCLPIMLKSVLDKQAPSASQVYTVFNYFCCKNSMPNVFKNTGQLMMR